MTRAGAAVIERLRETRLIAVLRSASGEAAIAEAIALHRADVAVIELTTTTPGWAEALAELRRLLPDALLGVGTVTSAADASRAIGADADFIVSPYEAPQARAVASRQGVVMIEGAFTPREIATAAEHGAVKLFPAAPSGPDYLRAVLQVLPDALVIPSGGIAPADVPTWLEAGALAVAIGSQRIETAASLRPTTSARPRPAPLPP